MRASSPSRPNAFADELVPFEASYTWIWHGLRLPNRNYSCRRAMATWIYQSRSEPRGIGRLMSERPVQRSVMRVTDAGVQPLTYQADDGTPSTKRDADVTYDWNAHRVNGTYEDKKVDMPLVPGIQDDLSVHLFVFFKNFFRCRIAGCFYKTVPKYCLAGCTQSFGSL